MAGIGFELRKLTEHNTLTTVPATGGHAAVSAIGPWLVAILALASIGIATGHLIGADRSAGSRVVIVYAFAISLVFAAPAMLIATRLVVDSLWLKRLAAVRPLLLAALATVFVATGAGSLVPIAVFRPAPDIAITLAGASMLAGLVWVVLAFCGAVRDYAGVALSLLLGVIVSAAGAMAAAVYGGGPMAVAWGVLIGLSVTFFGLASRVLVAFPHVADDPRDGLHTLASGFAEHWRLALGAFAGAIGIWIDKWLLWFSDRGEVLEIGLRHAPLYDGAMLIAMLGIIPALAAFIARLETDVLGCYWRYIATIAGHGTYRQIEDARAHMHTRTLENLALMIVAQVGISAIVLLLAPVLIEVLGFQARQILVLRYGALGALFHVIFMACSFVLLVFDRQRSFLWLQVLFVTAMAGATYASLQLRAEYQGAGYLAACMLAALASYRLANRTLAKLNYLTFIGNNQPVAASPRIGPETDNQSMQVERRLQR